MTDLLGPASALNSVTARPSDTRTFGVADTWLQPCSAPGRQDGTQLQAVFLNAILAQLRAAIRGAGITVDNTDDTMLLKAMEAVGIRYVVDTSGTANQIVVAPTIPVTALTAGLSLRVLVANAVTGAATIAVSGLTAVALKRSDGTAIQSGDISAGQLIEVACDGAAFRLQSARQTAALVTDGTTILGAGTPASPLAVNTGASFHSPGYVRLTSGVVLQWVTGASVTGGSSTTQTVVWPIAFPNACLMAFSAKQAIGTANAGDYTFEVISTSTTAVALLIQSIGGNTGDAGAPLVFAIGY